MRFAAEDLVVRYPGAPRAALDGVSMTVPDGRLYAVLGPNGSGKSTLMKALLGIVRPQGGRALLDDRPILDWTRRDLARVVGVVPQAETLAFPIRVRELVAMGRYPHLGALGAQRQKDRQAVDRALAQCDVEELADRDVTTLSGGELQRVRITASLDIRHEMAILESLRNWADQGMTVVVVTHGLDLAARFADRLLLLSRGRVAAEGPPGEVLRADVLEEVYRWRIAVETDRATGAPRVTPLRSDQSSPSG